MAEYLQGGHCAPSLSQGKYFDLWITLAYWR